MDTDARPVVLAFTGILCGALALAVALLAGDSAAALGALAMVTYCGAEFMCAAAWDV